MFRVLTLLWLMPPILSVKLHIMPNHGPGSLQESLWWAVPEGGLSAEEWVRRVADVA